MEATGNTNPQRRSRRRRPSRMGVTKMVLVTDDLRADKDFIDLLHGSDLVKIELNRLENEVRGTNGFDQDVVMAVSVCYF